MNQKHSGFKKVQGQSEAAVYVATRFDIKLRYIGLQPNCYPFIPMLHLYEGSNMLNLFKVCAIFRILKCIINYSYLYNYPSLLYIATAVYCSLFSYGMCIM